MARRTEAAQKGSGPAADDVRRAVLDAAIEVIASSGPDQVSMRDVARRAGVSHQAPYHHFTDRAGIFAAIAEEGFRRFADEFKTVLDESADPLTDCLRHYVRFALSHQGHFKVMFRSDICGVLTHESTRAAADDAYLVLLDFAERTAGPASPDALMTRAVLLWAQAHGLATLLVDGPLARKLPETTTLDEFIDTVAAAAGRVHGGAGITPAP